MATLPFRAPSRSNRTPVLEVCGCRSILLLAAFASLAVPSAFAQSARPRPNILFFLVDDQRDDTLGCAGHAIVRTPNIDRLAERGVRFANAFVTTSICAASRASILTGLYERAHGYSFGKPPIASEITRSSYPAVLKRAGYRTGFAGKFGVRLEQQSEAVAEMFDFFRPIAMTPALKEQPDGSLRHETELCGDAAIEFLRALDPDQPFCLSISFNAAHAQDGDKRPGGGHYPWPHAVDGLYEDIAIPPPRLSAPEIFESQPDFLKASLNRERYFWRWDTPAKYEANMRAYFRMLSGVDRVIGRVLDELERAELSGDTIVVYSADNGYYMGDRGFAGKWSHYEQSLRVPLIVCDPRAEPEARGRVLDAFALNVDLPASFLDWASVPLPAHYQGSSLAGWLMGDEPSDWRDDFFCEHLMDAPGRIPKWQGVRGARYVYAHYFEHGFEFLHDLERDPDQLVNLATDEAFGELIAVQRARCEEWRASLEPPAAESR